LSFNNKVEISVDYELLDDDELLSLSLDAISNARDEDAVVLLKVLVNRNPAHAMGHYLLAAQHAQLGLFERAESEFRRTAELAPDFAMARFQLGQLLLVKGDAEGAVSQFNAVGDYDPALRAYAEGLAALATQQPDTALSALRRGLALPQAVAALTGDMQRLADQLQAGGAAVAAEAELTERVGATMLLSNYNRYN